MKHAFSPILFAALVLCGACKDDKAPASASDAAADTFLSEISTAKKAAADADAKATEGKKDLLEIPVSATGTKEQIIYHTGYTTSYNSEWCIPNWVAYELTRDEARAHQTEREGEFQADPQAKGRSVSSADYASSGYGRGHMAPAGDMKWSNKAMRESFYLSNVCPQKKALNAGLWNDLELGLRRIAKQNGNVWIVCGPIVSKNHRTIGRNRVAVPDKFFKVVCRKEKGKYIAIGYVFPNSDCKGSVPDYACSVDEVERLTGIDFFSLLPDNVEDAMERTYDASVWPY